METQGKIFSVFEFNEIINQELGNLGVHKVQGEISQFKNYRRFGFVTLKDIKNPDYSIECYIEQLKIKEYDIYLEDGFEVVLSVLPRLHTRRGQFSPTIQRVEAVGEGALKIAFEKLKKKLEAKGYFDSARKRPTPAVIQNIGLITSGAGKVIRDFQENTGEYGFRTFHLDVRVEGESAEKLIISAITTLNKTHPELDILVLIRGGGGIENLKVFNSEKIADAIVTSRIPVFTGIGHEPDETIADLVADMRFSTPTAVAIFIRNQREELIRKVQTASGKLTASMESLLREKQEDLIKIISELTLGVRTVLEYHRNKLRRISSRASESLHRAFREFDAFKRKLIRSFYGLEKKLREQDIKLHRLSVELPRAIGLLIASKAKIIERFKVQLKALGPENVLKRGYSITSTLTGETIRDVYKVRNGQKIRTLLARGSLLSKVENIRKIKTD